MQALYHQLAQALDGSDPIEAEARPALLDAALHAVAPEHGHPLAQPFLDILLADNAHPVCSLIAEARLPWAPPQVSNDPRYIEHSKPKVMIDLLGPEGLVKSDTIRIGLYGMLPNCEYGIRSHLAEEAFIMIAGEAYWKQGDREYVLKGPGERSIHASMLPHANRTGSKAFLSIYVWRGDISEDSYVYKGIE